MKKGSFRKKIIKVISIALVLFILGVGYVFLSYKLNPIEVVEISILQEEFEIESQTVKVVFENGENVATEIEESNDKVVPTQSGGNSASVKKQGGGTAVSQATYTPKIQIPRTRVNLTVYSEMTVRNMERGVSILSTDNTNKFEKLYKMLDSANRNGEKIDIFVWKNNPIDLIAEALSPAKVVSVMPDEKEKRALVIANDDQFSLAIGRNGQNAKLAAFATGWKIDIKKLSEAYTEGIDFRYNVNC